MKVEKLALGRIFDRTERLEAPLFQRPYVWKQDDNWTPLWDAIRELADHKIAGQPARPHFMGAIVMDQLRTVMAKVPARQIIDGQQRLTTLQLSLAAIRDIAGEAQQSKHAAAFRKLTDNDGLLSEDPTEKFKVWPTNADRTIFGQVMSAGAEKRVRAIQKNADDGDQLIPGAYLYFAEEFRKWLGSQQESEFVRKLETMYLILRDDLHMVVIDLEADDDAQEIFETLNALGTPLLPADLVKNYLFRTAQIQKLPTERLYDQFWATFDTGKSYWRERVSQGRLYRPRLDLFLQNYLTLMLAADINAQKLFTTFRDHVENSGADAAKHMALFRQYGDVYKSMEELPLTTREGMFIYRLGELDTTTFYPVLLEVFKRYRNPEHRQDFEQTLVDLESYLVRRTVCGLTTKNYNDLVVRLIKHLRASDDFSSTRIRSFFMEQTADTGRWPDDEEFRKNWMTIAFYKALKRSKGRMILEALELATYNAKTEKVEVERKLTIEHLMPVSWERHWPIVVREVEELDGASDRRNEAIHRIGNLTLLTKELNPAVSNGAWIAKRDEILKHSALNLNRQFQKVQVWDEKAIEERSGTLFDVAKKIWPRPASVFAANA